MEGLVLVASITGVIVTVTLLVLLLDTRSKLRGFNPGTGADQPMGHDIEAPPSSALVDTDGEKPSAGADTGDDGTGEDTDQDLLTIDGILAGYELSTPPPRSDELVLVQALDDDQAIVIGSETSASQLGLVLGAAGSTLMRSTRHASAAASAAVAAAERTGYLVQVTPETWRKMHELQRINKGDYFLGVFRSVDGKFRHVAQLKPANLARMASSGSAIVSALAMQAQLDRIERTLGRISRDVANVQYTLERRHEAELVAAQRLLGEIYGQARNTGTITETMWSQIAGLAHATYVLQEDSLLLLRRLKNDLEHLPTKARDRREKLDEILRSLEEAFRLVNEEERAVVQFQILRLWRLTTACDPSINFVLDRIRREALERQELVRETLTALERAATDADVLKWFQRVQVINAHQIRKMAEQLRGLLERNQELAQIPVPTLPRRSVEYSQELTVRTPPAPVIEWDGAVDPPYDETARRPEAAPGARS